MHPGPVGGREGCLGADLFVPVYGVPSTKYDVNVSDFPVEKYVT